MLIPIVSDKVHAPLAVEFVRLTWAANQVIACEPDVPVHCWATKRVDRKAIGLFMAHTDGTAEIRVACPYKSARRDNRRRLATVLAHELMHLEQWLRGDPLTEPAPGRDLIAWENAMLARIFGALPCQTPTVGTLTTKKTRT